MESIIKQAVGFGSFVWVGVPRIGLPEAVAVRRHLALVGVVVSRVAEVVGPGRVWVGSRVRVNVGVFDAVPVGVLPVASYPGAALGNGRSG